MKAADIPQLVFFIVVCQLAGGIGSYSPPGHTRMVCRPEKAAPDAAGLGFCPGLDHALYFDGNRRLPDLAGEPVWKTAAAGPFLFGLQLVLNALWSYLFFRPPVPSGRGTRHGRPGRLHFSNPPPLPPYFLCRRGPPRPLSPVGGLCRRFEFCDLYSELLKNDQTMMSLVKNRSAALRCNPALLDNHPFLGT